MKKLLSLFIFFIAFFLSPQAAYSQNENFTVTQEPEKTFWFEDKNRKIKLTIRSKQPGYFLEKTGYTFVIWFKKNQEGNFRKELPISTNGLNAMNNEIKIIENGQALKVQIDKLDRSAESGWWPYWIYAGTGKDYRKTPLIYKGRVKIPPCHRDTDCLTSFDISKNQFKGNTNILFEIVDPNPNPKDYKYKLWFEGGGDSKVEFKPPSENITLLPQQPIVEIEPPFVAQDNPRSVYTGNIETPKPRTQPYTLCFSEGDECDFAIPEISIVAYDPNLYPREETPEEGILTEGTPDPVISIRYREEDSSAYQDEPSPTRPPLPCKKLDDEKGECVEIETAVGPVRLDPFEFVKSMMSVLLSLAGGIAVILIIISGYRLMTSQGNPEAVQAAREQLTSAIVGLVFIIFSLVILQVIGVDILQIPGFER